MRTSYVLKGYFSLALLLSTYIFVFGQDSTASVKKYTADSTALHSTYISVKQDPKLSELLYKYKDYNRKKEFMDGYRIQIMYTDIRTEAYKSKGEMYQQFPDLASYVEYEQPSYKLRIGDFKTRLEATLALQEVVQLYSGAFIVKDKIKIKKPAAAADKQDKLEKPEKLDK